MLPRLLKEIRFDSGLNTKGDHRAQPEQLLDIAVNVEFDDIGGLRCRFPFGPITGAIAGGGTIANARRLATLDDEHLLFTSTALYSQNVAGGDWVYKGDHLAVAVDEATIQAAPGDQFCADLAQVNGYILYAWQNTAAPGVISLALVDASTGSVVSQTTYGNGGSFTANQPRLFAMATNVLMVFSGDTVLDGNAVYAVPVGVAGAIAVGTLVELVAPATSTPIYFDAAKVPGQNWVYVAVPNVTSGGGRVLWLGSVDGTTAAVSSSQLLVAGASENIINAPVSVSVSADGTALALAAIGQVTAPPSSYGIDGWMGAVTAENVAPSLNPAGFGLPQVLGTFSNAATLSQLTSAVITNGASMYKASVHWTVGEVDNAVFDHELNWIQIALPSTVTIGAQGPFVYALGIGSHAFTYNNVVYHWGTFAGLSFAVTDPTGTHSELQNTYYLYRDDGLLVAKAVWGEGAGLQPSGYLPSVTAVAGSATAMVWMGGIRRIVAVASNATKPVTGASNYAERAPRQITFTFDDNRARRCVQCGSTLYVTGGIVLQYDGAQLTEVGFCAYPWLLAATQGGAGNIAPNGYTYKATNRWNNAKGEIDRSTTATVDNLTVTASSEVAVQLPNLYITRKSNVALEAWRTQGNPAAGVPFFLVTSQDASQTGAATNPYLLNAPTTMALASFSDNLADASIAVLAANPENNAVLPNIEPPPASIAYTDSQRIYLAGIPGYPNTVYYSKYRQPGLVAAFSDTLSFETPADGGAITAIDVIDGALIIWCETATYQYAGMGFDDTGNGSNFALARILSSDLGCVAAEARAYFVDGWMVKTSKGWFLLDRSLTYNYVGAGPKKYDSESVLAMSVLTARHQVRILTTGRMLIFDTLVKQWAESSIADGVDLALWDGVPTYLTATGSRAELATWTGYAGTDYTLTDMDFESSWIKFGETMQSRAIVDFVQLLGEFRSTCVVRVRVAKDYEAASPGVWNYNTDVTWTPSPGTAGSSLQVRQGPRWKRVEALKTRFTITAPGGANNPLGGPCARLTTIAIQHALEPNAYGAISAAQKQ